MWRLVHPADFSLYHEMAQFYNKLPCSDAVHINHPSNYNVASLRKISQRRLEPTSKGGQGQETEEGADHSRIKQFINLQTEAESWAAARQWIFAPKRGGDLIRKSSGNTGVL